MSIFEGYQSDIIQKPSEVPQALATLPIRQFKLLPLLLDTFKINLGRDTYFVVGGNLVVPHDINLSRVGGPGTLGGFPIRLPKPLIPVSGTFQTLYEKNFFYQIRRDGTMRVQGTIENSNDSVICNFTPYVAKYPLEFLNVEPEGDIGEVLPQSKDELA